MHNFDGNQWMFENIKGANQLEDPAKRALSNFTLMWNLFEGLNCKQTADMACFGKLRDSISPQSTNKHLVDIFGYYQNRYLKDGNFTDKFSALEFRRNNDQGTVEQTLKKDNPDLQEIVYALLIIIYRLRNNLFHGIKSFDTLNEQAENLDTAALGISVIMECLGGYYIETMQKG